jgi:hypothetical protein
MDGAFSPGVLSVGVGVSLLFAPDVTAVSEPQGSIETPFLRVEFLNLLKCLFNILSFFPRPTCAK